MESTSTQQEEPLDLSVATGNGDDQQQIIQFVETCGMVLQQNLLAWLLQSMLETPTAAPSESTAVEECPEKENTNSNSVEENESAASPLSTRRRTSTGKVDRRMVGKLCTRRVEANARERNRVQQLSKMFDQLRVCLPVGDDTKISKLATLKVASAYIGFLGSVLNNNSDDEEKFRTRLQLELESAKMLRK